MKIFTKTICLTLAAVLLLSLTGCGFIGKERTQDEEKEQLLAILSDLSNNLHPGTAGSSLTSVRLAADLVTWAATAKMDKKEAAEIVMNWLKEQSPDIRRAFQEKVESVSESYGKIIRDGASDLLNAAGIKKDTSNLGSRLKELVETILASGGLD